MVADYKTAVAQHLIDLYQESGETVGLIEVIPQKDFLLIENLAVAPQYQGKGIGDHLLSHAEIVARSLNLCEVRLYTNAAFTENVSYYSKRGYEVFAKEPIATGGTAVHMKKTLVDE